MKYDKEIIEFLENELKQSLKSLFLMEADYRAVTSLFMTNPKNNDINANQTKIKRNKEALETRVRNIRQVIQELKDGRLVVE